MLVTTSCLNWQGRVGNVLSSGDQSHVDLQPVLQHMHVSNKTGPVLAHVARDRCVFGVSVQVHTWTHGCKK